MRGSQVKCLLYAIILEDIYLYLKDKCDCCVTLTTKGWAVFWVALGITLVTVLLIVFILSV